MRILKTVLLVIFTFTIFTSSACLNEFGINADGHKSHEFSSIKSYPFQIKFDKAAISQSLHIAKAQLKKEYNYKTHSNIAVYLLKLGKFTEGLAILIDLNKQQPDNYAICANLGTAYELNGALDSALFYIQKGIQLNSNSHYGSEWIHVKILETKIKLKQDPRWLEQHTIIDVHPDSLRKKSARAYKNQILNQLVIQLRERIPFTPLPDEIIGHLFLELGDIYTTISIEDAYIAYHIAHLFSDETSIDSKIKNMEVLMETYKVKKPDLKKNLAPYLEKKIILQTKTEVKADSLKKEKDENIQPEKIILFKPVKIEDEKKDNNLTYLLWGLLPVIIALIYIAYRNKKYRKQ